MVKKSLKVILASAVILGGSVYTAPGAFHLAPKSAEAAYHNPDKPFHQNIIARFKSENAMRHLSYLSETIGPRVAGTEEERTAANYIKNELEHYGYEVSTQEFSIPDRLSGSLSVGGEELQIRLATGSAPTNGPLAGEVVLAGLGKPGDFPADTAGKIALIQRGEISFWDKAANAIQAGAIGVIIYDNADALVPPTPSLGGQESSIPVAAVTKADGEKMAADIQQGTLTATLEVESMTNQTSQNVIAVKKATHAKGKADIVYVSAHYDSVPYSPGASDNGSGTSVTLEMARILSKMPTNKELRFVFVGAEEIGLLGSEYYVSQLSKEELDRSLANYNLDMVGTAWENATALYVNVVDGQPNIVWQTAKETADRLGNDTLVLYQRGASDHVSFHDAGIPSANFIRREPGTAALEPWYHTPFDTMEHVSEERLQEAGELIGVTLYDLVNHKSGK